MRSGLIHACWTIVLCSVLTSTANAQSVDPAGGGGEPAPLPGDNRDDNQSGKGDQPGDGNSGQGDDKAPGQEGFKKVVDIESEFWGGKVEVEQGVGKDKDKIRLKFPQEPKALTLPVRTDSEKIGCEKVTLYFACLDGVKKAGGELHYGVFFLACFEVCDDCKLDDIRFVQIFRKGTSVKCNGVEEFVGPLPQLDKGTGATEDKPVSGPTAVSDDKKKIYFFDNPGRKAPDKGETCVFVSRLRLFKYCGEEAREVLGFFDWRAEFTVATDNDGKTTKTFDLAKDVGATNFNSYDNKDDRVKRLPDAINELNELVRGKDFTMKEKK